MFGFARRLAVAGFVVAGLVGASAPSVAQEFSSFKIIAPAGAGGGWDSAARSLQEVMTKTGVARSVQVINVPGAGGTIGLAQFANDARGSGDQLLVGGLVMVGAILTNQAPVDLSAVTPMARLTGDPLVIVVPKDSKIQTIAELQQAVKDDVASAIWAGGSAGGADHILAGLFAKAAGADPAKINYVAFSGGGEALAAMLGGRVTAGISGYGEFEGQIESGELRALAISAPERVEGIDIPTLKEQSIDVELVNWRGVFAGPGISDEDKAKLSAGIEKVAKSPEWAETLKARGWTDFYMPADEFASFITEENQRVAEILKSIGLVN